MNSIETFSFSARFWWSFRHASATRSSTENIIVRVGDGDLSGFGEGCPRDYVTSETVESAGAFIQRHRSAFERFDDLAMLRAWMSANREEVDQNSAAFAAVELAFLDLFGRLDGLPLEALLGLPEPPETVRYSAIMGDASVPATLAMAAAYRLAGFRDLKIKLSGDTAKDASRLRAGRIVLGSATPVRGDLNNRFTEVEDAVRHASELAGQVWAVEEPLQPRNWSGLSEFTERTGVPVILDESVTRMSDLENLAGDPARWIVNVRVSKMGGIQRAQEVVEACRHRGHGVIIGAHVGETSLLTRSALCVAAACPGARMEGGFGRLLLRQDLASPSLRFGRGGRLRRCDFPCLLRPGSGFRTLAGRLSAIPLAPHPCARNR